MNNKSLSLVKSFVLGAGLMYFFDPDEGRRRRALIRDQGVRLVNRTSTRLNQAKFEWRQKNWTPGVRLLAFVAGSVVGLYGWRRGGVVGAAAGLAGFGLALRSLTNRGLKQMAGVENGRQAIEVEKTINIDAPVEEVYAFWSNFQNLPRFMAHVRGVLDLGGGRSHWAVAGPGGVSVEWDAEITEQAPNEVIAWQSVPGELVKSSGQVNFTTNEDGSSRLTVWMSYTPLAGGVGHVIAKLWGADPKQAMDEDFVRLKSLLEVGKTTVAGREVTREAIEWEWR